MTAVSTITPYLDVLLKITAISLGVYLMFLLRNLNTFIQKAERSVESVEHSAEAVEKSVKWGRILPFVGGDK